MGVPGLWKARPTPAALQRTHRVVQELQPAATPRSLTHLAVTEGFQANPSNQRGYRLGIDASIWFFHAEYGKEGENPELRTLFFRCATLMHAPFLPLFVFDGPHRPDLKRNKRISKSKHALIPGMKGIVEAFGFEWRDAPGEAEAELAYLNRIGVIDGVLSDDVDNFLFGAQTVIRNPSNKLSGNRSNPVLNADGRDDNNHSRVFRMSDIETHPEVSLTRGDMILIGLCSGGDYDTSGMTGCGPKIARGLVKYGLGRSLYDAARNLSRDELKTFLHEWRNQMRHDLRTDSKGYIGQKCVALSKRIPEAFPDIDIVLSYVQPITSESPLLRNRDDPRTRYTWSKEPDLGKLAFTCEKHFEWGYRDMIIKRFKTVIWPGAVLRVLRRGVLEMEKRERVGLRPPMTPRKNSNKPVPENTPSKMIAEKFSSMRVDDDDDQVLITKITLSREHASTDHILEYRLEIDPAQLVRLAESGMQGLRTEDVDDEFPELAEVFGGGDSDDDGKKKKGKMSAKWRELPEEERRELELKPLKVWMPACMVRAAEPRLVREWEEKEEAKRAKKASKGRGKGKAKAVEDDEDEDQEDAPAKPKPKPRAKAKAAKKVVSEDEADALPKPKPKAKPAARKTAAKPKPKAAPVPEEEEESSPSRLPSARMPNSRTKAAYVDVSTDEELEDEPMPTFSLPPTAKQPTASTSASADPFARPPRPPPGVVRDLTLSKSSASTSKSAVRDLTKPREQADMKNYFPLAKARERFAKAKADSAPLPLRPTISQAPARHSASVLEAIESASPSPKRARDNAENRSVASAAASPSKLVPQPFPLELEKLQLRRRPSDLSEDDAYADGRVARLNKSPRKSREHTSPRKAASARVSRSPSPSPASRRPFPSAAAGKNVSVLKRPVLPVVRQRERGDVIVISSDEEDGVIDISD
ncbi:hypothetical protein HMN09_00579300 [Mycena chlorophos]|uniref:XPG-I domain-containing protein n=1 Tax=Mycena chlorophos TaxID=658473 RepID=A0A8H6T3L5_MYCCL|nr:hypothetical protein HMN09_00579300 [Mycena chlorophos]